MKYTILYEYLHWMCGCDCCSDSSSEIRISEGSNLIMILEHVDLMEDADELLAYIQENYPEFSDCVIDPESIWF